MKPKDRTLRVDRLVWRFQKSGGEGEFAKVFANFPAAVQVKIRNLSGLRNDESPALAQFFAKDKWVLITSQRLIWSDEGGRDSVELAQIMDATVKTSRLVEAGKAGKLGLRFLTIKTSQAAFDIELESGSPFFGFWNVIKMIAAQNIKEKA